MNYQPNMKFTLMALMMVACAALGGCDSDESSVVIVGPTATTRITGTPGATATPTASPTAAPSPASSATASAAASTTATAVPTATSTAVTTAAHGALFVADAGNFRVHAFLPPFVNGMKANLAIGQSGLDEFEASDPTRNTVGFPVDAVFDSSGKLWVVDLGNSRMLRFPTPFTTGMNADLVLGQSDFLSGSPNLNENAFNSPLAAAVDRSADVFVADAGNSRIMEFTPPLASGMSASVVIGQVDFTSNSAATAQSGLSVPSALVFDPAGNLWVADNNNNRVLRFLPPFTTGMKASLVLGQPDFTTNLAPAPSRNSMSSPYGVAVDASGELFVADANNNRVLIFRPPLHNSMDASVAIGQPDLVHGSAGTAANQLSLPQGIAVDSGGNLWVADASNNRVLEFKPPFATGMNASMVFGQLNFTTHAEGEEAGDFTLPLAVAVKP